MNSCLLFVNSKTPFTEKQILAIRRAMRDLAKQWKSSSVFEMRENGEALSYGAAICFDGFKAPLETLSVLKIAEKETMLKIYLLSMNQTLRLDPQCVLPHPLLIEDQSILAISAEIMPQYFHPISQMTLSEIYGKQKNRTHIEFYDTTIHLL